MTWAALAAWLASAGPPVRVGRSAGIQLNSNLITALVIGIPATLVAVGSYWLSLRARREAAEQAADQVDAAAYTRARELYESAIGEMHAQSADMRGEITRLRQEVDGLRAEIDALRTRSGRGRQPRGSS